MASASAQPRTRLHVGGLPRELLDDELRARFAPFGEVRSVEVLREKPESPFFRREGEGSGGEDSESDSDVQAMEASLAEVSVSGIDGPSEPEW